VLRAVAQVLDRRLDGVLPRDVPGVAECFADDADLVGALTLSWHAHLGARLDVALEAAQRSGTTSRPQAVTRAWADAAEQLRGVRRLLDRQAAEPASAAVAEVLARSAAQEHALLARAAEGAAALRTDDDRTQAVGRRLERQARAQVRPALADRIRALVPA
jgi:hypothetical protein